MSDLSTNEVSLDMSTAREIKKLIVQGKMHPGDRLPTEKDLMRQFGISRSTLRESLKILKAENVIVSRQGSGTFISKDTGISEDPLGLHFADRKNLFRNLLETRLVIEPGIAMLAAERASEEDLKNLRDIVSGLYQSEANDENTEKLDAKFHTAIAECTHNDVLTRVVPIIIESIQWGHIEMKEDLESLHRAQKSHYAIYKAIAGRNVLQAKYLVEQHIHENLDLLEEDRNKEE